MFAFSTEDIQAIISRIKQQEPMDTAILDILGPTSGLFTQNPFSAQISCMALAQGRRFTHHELRGYIPVPEELEPEIPVWEFEQNTPLWIDGVRRNPKHFCFRLDAVFPTFHPNYRSKWPAHELLHSLCGYFWHPEQTRFECYVGARLAELLPLTHWYGLDEVARKRCAYHTQKPPSKEYCRACESMFVPYWETEWNAAQHIHSQKALEFAFVYYQEEREACLRELQTNRRIEIPRVLLDSSSDALGYLEGHWNRLCSWSFGAFDDLFVRKEEKHDSLEGFMVHIDNVFAQLLAEEISIPEQEQHDTEHQVRLLQDLGKRILVALEWGTETDRDACWSLLAQAADFIHGAHSFDLLEWKKDMKDCLHKTSLPSEVLGPVFQTGLMEQEWSPSLHEGITQSFEASLDETLLEDIVQSKTFWSLGHLWDRIPKAISKEEIALEGWLKRGPSEDRQARLFAMPYSDEEGFLRLNTTFRKGRFSKEAMEAVLGWGEEEPIVAWWHRGAPFVLVMDDGLNACVAAVEVGTWRENIDEGYIEELVSIGLLVWMPRHLSSG